MPDRAARSNREGIERVLRYLDEEGADHSLEALSAIAHLSPFHFHRVFKACTGLPVAAYVRRHRLIAAAGRLSAGAGSVPDIALDAGFGSHEAFTRAFAALFGLSPSAFRKLARAGAVHGLPSPKPLTPPEGKDMELTIQHLPVMRVACVRHTGPYAACQPAWDKLCAWGMRQRLMGPETLFLGVSWDDPDATPPEEIRYDACMTVPDSVESDGDVRVSTVGGGPHASVVHLGSHDGLAETYRQLYAALMAREDLRLAEAPPFELYRNDPKTTPPDKLVTEIYVSLASAGE